MAHDLFGITENCPYFGKAVIFSFESFDSNPEAVREGSEVDRENLIKLFQDMGLLVSVELNRTAEQVRTAVMRIAGEDQLDLFICVFMSHGHSNKYFYTYDGESMDMDILLEQFERSIKFKNCVKIYLANFCRATDAEDDSSENQQITHNIRFTNTLKVFSTLPGDVSWRNKKTGSYFISNFVKAARNCEPHFELTEILNQANSLLRDKVKSTMESLLAKGKLDIFMKQALQVENYLTSRCYLVAQVRFFNFLSAE